MRLCFVMKRSCTEGTNKFQSGEIQFCATRYLLLHCNYISFSWMFVVVLCMVWLGTMSTCHIWLSLEWGGRRPERTPLRGWSARADSLLLKGWTPFSSYLHAAGAAPAADGLGSPPAWQRVPCLLQAELAPFGTAHSGQRPGGLLTRLRRPWDPGYPLPRGGGASLPTCPTRRWGA